MKTTELFKSKKVFSLEIFPPKRTSAVKTIYDTVEELKTIKPDFISVTYGAGGSGNKGETIRIASAVKNVYGVESIAHLACIHLTKQDVLGMLEEFRVLGVENVMALRGDIHPDYPVQDDFKYASDLVSFIKEHSNLNVLAACYPEGHRESASLVEDIHHLKAKVDAGAEHLVTQLFFDNRHFYSFRERAAIAGIRAPIEAGIMPVTNRKQIERMVSLCGVELPKKFLWIMERYEHNAEAMRDAGIAYAIDQIVDLITQGVDGIHLYTMNNPYIAHRIHEAVRTLLDA